MEQCCCGKYRGNGWESDEPFIENDIQHEKLGPAKNFCGPIMAHDLRDKNERISALEAELRGAHEARAMAEALVISHEGHITQLEAELASVKEALGASLENHDATLEELTECRNAILREGLMVEELKEQLANMKQAADDVAISYQQEKKIRERTEAKLAECEEVGLARGMEIDQLKAKLDEKLVDAAITSYRRHIQMLLDDLAKCRQELAECRERLDYFSKADMCCRCLIFLADAKRLEAELAECKAKLFSSIEIQSAEKKILLCEIESHTATRARLAEAEAKLKEAEAREKEQLDIVMGNWPIICANGKKHEKPFDGCMYCALEEAEAKLKRRAVELCDEWWDQNMAKAEEGKEFDFGELIRAIEEMEP